MHLQRRLRNTVIIFFMFSFLIFSIKRIDFFIELQHTRPIRKPLLLSDLKDTLFFMHPLLIRLFSCLLNLLFANCC